MPVVNQTPPPVLPPAPILQLPANIPVEKNWIAEPPTNRQSFWPIALGLISVVLAGCLFALHRLQQPHRPPPMEINMTGVVARTLKPTPLKPTDPAPEIQPDSSESLVSTAIAAPSNPSPSPAQQTSAAIPAPPPAPVELVPARFHPVKPADSVADMDAQIGQSIDAGVNYLLSQFVDGHIKTNVDNESATGMDALAVYALLQAGEATHDLRLEANSSLVGRMLDALKGMKIVSGQSTYSHSLRVAALSVYHRAADKQALRSDTTWLIADSSNGAFSYDPPRAPAPRERPGRFSGYSPSWDNSNSQYGALGVWAALEAGVEVPNSFWQAVQKHWLGCQLPDGEWAYTGYGDMGRLSMTVAGITTLFVTEDQLEARSIVSTLGHAPFNPALARGLKWLETEDNSVDLPRSWRTYNLFGLERAALASGFKYFGTHDWYRELAREQLRIQQADGSWTGYHPIVDTAYTLLFLSRGRHPIFMNKLRFDGFWSNRPRDISNLAHYASTVLERPLNWQVVSLHSNWSDWMDSPVLYIASHEALKLTDADCDKLRAFAENGGLIFTHADGDSIAFNKSITELSHRLWPQYPLTDLPTTHPIFSTLYKIKLQPRLQGISNGSRLLLVHSPTDINKTWQQRDWAEHPTTFQMGINIFIYAAGKANLRNKLKTTLVDEPSITPIQTTMLAQLQNGVDSNPEPAAWPRFAREFFSHTSVKVDVTDIDSASLDSNKMPMAHLTGTRAIHFTSAQLKNIHDYVNNGGTLLIDACGGSPEFMKSMLLDFLPHAFPKSPPKDVPANNLMLLGSGEGMTPVNLHLRPYRTELDGAMTQPLQYFTVGKGMVILSTVDITTGLLGTDTWPVNGYEPQVAFDLVRNVLLSVLEK